MISPDKVITDIFDPFDDQTPTPAKKRRGASTTKSTSKTKKLGPFTTKAAREFAKARGWRIIDSEEYSHLTKTSKDCILMSDVVAVRLNEDGRLGIVLIQAGTVGEEKAHRVKAETEAQKFSHLLRVKINEATVETVCERAGWSYLWLEYQRSPNGHKKLIKQTWWAGGEA